MFYEHGHFLSGACCSEYCDELCFIVADENKIEFDKSFSIKH